MKAIILAAGKATRLLPLTKNMPQCMLKLGQKTILEIQVQNIKKAGIKDIVLVTGYLSAKLENFCKKLGVSTLFNPFYEVSGMALSLWIAKEELKTDCIVLYSDVLFDSKIITGLLEQKGDICLAIKKNGLREEAEKVIEINGIIKNMSKTQFDEANGEFIGIAKFFGKGIEKLLNELRNVAKINLNTSFIELLDNLIKKDEIVMSYDIQNSQFIDVDFPKDLEKAEQLFN